MIRHSSIEVSVVIPTFNSERFIGDSIKSALSQDDISLEVIVVDGGSTDRTVSIVESCREIDSRVRLVINEGDFGPAHARKIGIEAASGEFIAFLDSDDLWEAKKLRSQVYWMHEKKWDFTYCYYGLINDGEKCSFSAFKRYNFIRNLFFRGIANFTVVVRRNILTPDVLKFYPGEYAEDYLWWLLITKKGVTANLVPVYGGGYRVHENARSVNFLQNLKSVNFYLKEIFEISFGFRFLIFIIYPLDVLCRNFLYRLSLQYRRLRNV